MLIQDENIDLELDSNGILPIHQTVLQVDFAMFQLVAQKDNNLTVHDLTGNTILHNASKSGLQNFVESISSDHPCLARARNLKHETPLFKAVHKGFENIEKY